MKTGRITSFVGAAAIGLSFAALAAPVNLTGGGNHNAAMTPSISVEGSHRWVAWVEYAYHPASGSETVKLMAVRHLDDTPVEGPLEVATGRIMNPVVLAQANGDAWFFWIQVNTNGGRLKARRRTGGAWQSPADVIPGRAGYPAAHLDANGQPWVVFEAYPGSQVEIQVSHWTGSAFSGPVGLSQNGVNAYAPALELDAEGSLWVAWHAWVDHNYDVFARRRVSGNWGDIWQVTDAYDGGNYRGFHMNPTLHRGCCGVMWFAWMAKGLDVRAAGKPPHLHSWVQHRRIQLRRLQPDGQRDPVHQVPVPFDALAHDRHEHKYAGPEAPVLDAERGKIVVFYRVLSDLNRRYHWRVWMQYMNVSNDLWLANPKDVAQGVDSEGYRGPPGVDTTDEGFLAAFQRDLRTHTTWYPDGFAETESDILLAEILDTQLGAATVPSEAPTSYAPPLLHDQPRDAPALGHLGSEYQLYTGSLHDHTEYSICGHAQSARIREFYSRLRDAAALDFVALTDHGGHMSHHDWHAQRSHCALHNRAGGMTVLLGLEYTSYVYGHQNVIWAGCEGGLISRESQTTPSQVWNRLPAGEAITIPHHSAAASDYLRWDMRQYHPGFNRLFEIYQARGSFECYWCRGVYRDPWPSASDPKYHAIDTDGVKIGHYQDTLARGYRMGVIASPDHTGMWGLANVYAESPSQADLFTALWERRTFGVSNAAARITLDFRADGRLMGEEYELHGACPVFYGRVRTDYVHPVTGQPGVIEEVKIYRVPLGTVNSPGTTPGENGEIFKIEPGAAERTFAFHDADCPGTGAAAYYLRAIQSDVHGVDLPERPSIAWTSPVFIDWTPGDPSRNATMASHDVSGTMSPSGTQTATVTVNNAGDIPWTGKEGYLLSVNPGGLACDPVLLGSDEFVLPGQNHQFQVVIDAPAAPGTYTLVFQMDSPAGKFGQMLSVDVTVGEVVCVDGDTRLCGTDVGACESGLESCAAAAWGPCTGGVGPQAESCNGLDDDCDGAVPAGEADADADGYRICEGDCGDDNADVNPGQSEAGANCADGLDNDCDGDTDLEDPPCSVECSSDAQCSDGNVCNGAESCDGNQTCQPGTALDCDDGNPCTDDTCDPVTGCASSDNSLPCDDGDACTMEDTCQAGACSGEPLDADGDGHVADACGGPDCDDADSGTHPGVYESGAACTDGSDNDCDGLTDDADPGCMSCSADADCRDKNLCNGEESCSAGACEPGTPLDCDDGDPCTDDRCVPATGCEHTLATSEGCADEEPEIVISGSCGCGSGPAGFGLVILGLLVLLRRRTT